VRPQLGNRLDQEDHDVYEVQDGGEPVNGSKRAKLVARTVTLRVNGKCPICGKPFPCLDH